MKVKDCIYAECDCLHLKPNDDCVFDSTPYDDYLKRMNEQNRKDELFQARITWFVFGVVMGVAMSSTIYFFSI